MYKLENDVEWTEDLKNAFKHNVTRAKIIYNDGNDTIVIDENNGIKEITLEDNKYVPDVGFIGQAVAKKVTLILLDNEQTLNLENKEFVLYIGADYNGSTYYINYGNYIVNEPPDNDSTNGTVKIIAYDYMIKFNKSYVDGITYPCTLKQYVTNICAQAQVELGSDTFTNDDFIVVNNQFEGKTLREILQHVGKSAFSWARIGQDNKLYFDFKVNDNNAITETITIDDYKQDAYKRANEYYGPINKVTYGDSDIKGQEQSVQDNESIAQYGKTELVINDNYFAYTTSERSSLIQNGNVLFGCKYMPISQLDVIGLIYLDCNDFIEVLDETRNSILSRVFSHTIKYNGIISDTIETEGTSDNQENYKNINTSPDNNSKVEIMVDRANKKIESVVANVTEQNTKISQVTQTVDELSAQISDIADLTTYGESTFATVDLSDINESEPITLKVYPVVQNISLLYPRTNLYPSDTLYIPVRIIRFTNTTKYQQTSDTYYDRWKKYYSYDSENLEYILLIAGTDYIIGNTINSTVYENKFVDYQLPDDLLYYNNETYDEFYLDYNSETCQITKRCGYNADGTVYALQNEVINSYTYPTIELEEGNYTISIVSYDYGYIGVRLMAKNIYTTQFYTKSEVNSKIEQTATNINISVSQTLSNYSTTDQMNASISVSAREIKSYVGETYADKITESNHYSELKQTSREINAKVEEKVNNSDYTRAEIILKINNGVSSAKISADQIDIQGKTINLTSQAMTITSNNFSVNSNGYLTCSGANISGNITATSGSFNGSITTTSGTIGGFSIGEHTLSSGSGATYIRLDTNSGVNSAIWVGANSAGDAPFRVTKAGRLIANDASIRGTITADSGTFNNCTIKNTCTVPASTVSGTLSANTIPNISAGKITSGTMSANRISGGTMSGVYINAEDINCSTVEAADIVKVSNQYSHYAIGKYNGQSVSVVVTSGGSWKTLTFKGGILISVD